MSREQVSGLASLLLARSASQRRLALRSLRGGGTERLRRWRLRLVAAAADLNAFVDFAEDEHLHAQLLSQGLCPSFTPSNNVHSKSRSSFARLEIL